MNMSDSQRHFGLEIGFIDNFNPKLMTAINCSVIAEFHTLQIITAHGIFSVLCLSSGASW
jgi:hypothetical protein